MNEWDKAREEIACSLCGNSDICYSHKPVINGRASGDVCSISLIKADQLMALDCIQIKAEDQSLPEVSSVQWGINPCESCGINPEICGGKCYERTMYEFRKNLLNCNWMRVVEKEQ